MTPIKPISFFSENMIIENTGNIYFDFNEAIVTNTTQNWIPLEVGALPQNTLNSIRVFPNPSKGVFTLVGPLNGRHAILDLSGRKLFSADIQNKATIDLSMYPNGIYFVKLQMNEKWVTGK